MFENITRIDLKILSLFIKNYSSSYSIHRITTLLNINYSNTFKRVKKLVKKGILNEEKSGKSNELTLNIKNILTIHILSFIEQLEAKRYKNLSLFQIADEAIKIDPFACIGLFGSRVSGKAKKESDWDLFVIANKENKKELEKIIRKFPYLKNIQLLVFSLEEFEDSILSPEETVVKHIIKNKQIIYNPYPFYNIIKKWEMIKYAPTQ